MSTKGTVISLCDKTGNAVKAWAEAGYTCYCVDIQHSIRRDRVEGNIHYVWGDARSWIPPRETPIAFMMAFPMCTHLTVSGARDWQKKRGWMLADALELFDACRVACEYSRAPFYIENPVGRLSTHREKPNYIFDPCDYAGYLADPDPEAYTKKTCLWTGGGFVMPPKKRVEPVLGSLTHVMPPADNRADLRSVTPLGFSLAVFQANTQLRDVLSAA